MRRHLKEDFDLANKMVKRLRVNKKNISDGNHTFEELYIHRTALFLALMRALDDKGRCWIAKYHHDGTMLDEDLFIAGIGLKEGHQITYHIKRDWWSKFSLVARVYTYAPVEWDGHTPDDVIDRLIGGEF